jgi:O-antigen/teichoic acid export membrane protein
MSRAKSAFLGSISSQLFMVTTMLLAMVTTPYILKFLDQEEYGLSTILFQIIGYLGMFDFGLGSAIARYLASTRGDDETSRLAFNKVISTSFFVYTLLGAVVVFTGIYYSPAIPRLFHMSSDLHGVATSIGLSLSVLIGLQFPLRVFSSIFFAHQRQLLSNAMGFITNIINLVLPLIFLYLGYGLWAFVYTNAITVFIHVITTIYFMRRFYPFLKLRWRYFDKQLLSQMFGFGFFMFLNAIAVQVIFFTDRFFIGTFVSLSAVTVFYLSAKIPEIAMNLIFKITDNTYPAMVEVSTNKDVNTFKTVHHKLLLITTCCAAVAFWLVLIFSQSFIKLWVGPEFFAGVRILVLTLVLMLLHSIHHVTAVCLNGAGIVKGFTVVSIIEAGINVVLTLFLGKKFGIEGILLATIIANCLTSLWYTPRCAIKYMGISVADYLFRPVLIPLISVSVVGLLLFFSSKLLFASLEITWLTFTSFAIVESTIFAAFIWIIFLRKEFSYYIPFKYKRFLLLSS